MNIDKMLAKKFGYTKFREGQREIIEEILQGKDVVALLPTGAGKSLCYQLPSYLLDGVTIIVSPLLSLMEDQVNQLKLIGEKKAIAFNSFRSFSEKKYALENLGDYKFIFTSPEMLQSNEFLNQLQKLKIALFVVDEAHCISQWGHEFRPDYLKLQDYRALLNPFATLALTATASVEVIKDIEKYLGLSSAIRLIYSLDRPNLAYVVEKVNTIEEKNVRLLHRVKMLNGPGIIYCGSRNWTERITQFLKENGIDKVAYYHGGMPTEERMLIQQQYLNNQLDLIVCTSAFGMGVNKPNIRYVIHFQFPTTIEAYIQEIGRGGRDGKNSVAILLYTDLDIELPKLIIEEELLDERQVSIVLQMLKVIDRKLFIQKDEVDFLNYSGLNEIHWRFLKYHFEKSGVIMNGYLLPNQINEQIEKSIHMQIRNRKEYKFEKINKMIEWIHSSRCRRVGLLSAFHQEKQRVQQLCCDNCGVSLKSYEEKELTVKVNEIQSWEDELKQILCLK